MKKLLVVGHSLVLRQNRDVFRYLSQNGTCQVTVVAPSFFHGDLRDISCELEESTSQVLLHPMTVYLSKKIHFFFYHPREISTLLKQCQFDGAFLWEEPYIVSGYQWHKALVEHRIPYGIYVNQNILKNYPWPFAMFEKESMKKARRVYCGGSQVLDVVKNKGVQNGEHLPFFINNKMFKVKTLEAKKEALKNLGLNEDLPTLGFMGRLVEEKGILLFLKIAEKVLSKFKCNIIVIGHGDLEPTVRRWMEKQNSKNMLLAKLAHHEVPNMLANIDVILCPSQTRKNWKEQFGRMLIESFACGVAVVGSNSGEIPYVINQAGVVVGELDEEKWVRETLRLLEDKQERERLIRLGLNRAQGFSVENIAQKLWQSLNSFVFL